MLQINVSQWGIKNLKNPHYTLERVLDKQLF